MTKDYFKSALIRDYPRLAEGRKAAKPENPCPGKETKGAEPKKGNLAMERKAAEPKACRPGKGT